MSLRSQITMAPHRPNGAVRTELYLLLDGPDAGQFVAEPDDDFYWAVSAMTREEAIRVANLLLELWQPARNPP